MGVKRPISAEELGNFKIDEATNKLYWGDKPIKSENVHLSGLQKTWAFVVGISAALAGLTTFNQEFCLVSLGKSCQSPSSQVSNTPSPVSDSTPHNYKARPITENPKTQSEQNLPNR